MEDLIGYDEIIESSMRQVIYRVLKKIEKEGLKGNHHFVISFSTKYPGVFVPMHLGEKFPDEMTIVIQYQFDSLTVSEKDFKISLSFSGNQEKLIIPYLSITSFADPSINFGLKFSKAISDHDEDEVVSGSDLSSNVDLSAKIISLDAFRKNKDKKK